MPSWVAACWWVWPSTSTRVEGVVSGWGQLVEERLEASSELPGGLVGQVVRRAEVGPPIRVVERIVTVPGAVVVDDRVAG